MVSFINDFQVLNRNEVYDLTRTVERSLVFQEQYSERYGFSRYLNFSHSPKAKGRSGSNSVLYISSLVLKEV